MFEEAGVVEGDPTKPRFIVDQIVGSWFLVIVLDMLDISLVVV